MSRAWEAETDALLRAVPSRHPSTTVVEWFAHSEGRRDWFQSDGAHLTARGADAYAALVGSSLPPPEAAPPPTAPPG